MSQTNSTDTSVIVAKTATVHAEIELNRITLLGTFGTQAAPEALLRLPDGQIAKVSPGDKLGPDTVVAIDDDRLALGRGGTAHWLTIP